MSVLAFDPENWFVSLFRSLEDYVKAKADLDIYDVRGGFPSNNLLTELLPLGKTLIHFDTDDVNNPIFGFGENVVDNVYDDVAGTVLPMEAKMHTVNWDVGIWTSPRSGGTTARMTAYQLLTDLFTGVLAFRDLRDSRGIEIVSFNGGNFIEEEIDDITVFRVADMTLITRVFSKTTPIAPLPFIGDVTQIESITINPEGPILDSVKKGGKSK
jgi:hypothetical protein